MRVVFHRAIRYSARPATARRIRDAERRLRLQREALPLYYEEIKASQPTAEERVELCEVRNVEFWANMRRLKARHWREGRSMLRAAPPQHAAAAVSAWNNGPLPKDATYFVGFVRDFLGALSARPD